MVIYIFLPFYNSGSLPTSCRTCVLQEINLCFCTIFLVDKGKKSDLRNHMIFKIICLQTNQAWKIKKKFNPVQILCAAGQLYGIYTKGFILEKEITFLLPF